MSERLRIGVVGGGLIAQAIHLPNLERLTMRSSSWRSPTSAAAWPPAWPTATRPARAYTDWTAMLDDERLDALVVCSPHGTHAEVVLAALDRGLHVLVEKPLCIAPDDAAAICRARDETGLVVQVGYMKRYDPAYEALLDALPASADALRLVDVVTYDPWMAREPFVPWESMVSGDDAPQAALAAARAAEAEQVAPCRGAIDPAPSAHTATPSSPASSTTSTSCTECSTVSASAAPSSRWRRPTGPMATLRASPRDCPAARRGSPRGSCSAASRTSASARPSTSKTPSTSSRCPRPTSTRADAYIGELRHFHGCVVDGVACRTPPEQALRDVDLLRDLYRLTPSPTA